jgi:dolichol-phosphate mannosyltransferase
VLVLTKYSRRPFHLFGGLGLAFLFIGVITLLYLAGIHFFQHAAIGTRPLLTFGIFITLAGLQLSFTGLLAEMLVRSTHRIDPPIRAEWNGHGEL